MPSTGTEFYRACCNFSLPFGRVAGVPTRLSWMLLLWMAIDTTGFLRAQQPLMVPWALALPLGFTLLRATARVALVRALGGTPDSVLLWYFGDQTSLSMPLRAGSHFLVGIVGVAISLILWLGLGALALLKLPEYVESVLFYGSGINMKLCLFNLLPCLGFDGSRWLRGILWPLLGLARGVRMTVIASYVAAGLLTAYGLFVSSFMLTLFGLMLIMGTVYEDRLCRSGWDQVLGTDPSAPELNGTRSSWFARWKIRRAEARAEREEAAQANEQVVLDELLAKVSASGLPSLTSRERKILQNISKRQKSRLGEA